jgi:alpha-L-arabinofuranosidase
MIWFDGENSYGTPSYYVQQMYSTLMGTKLLQTVNKQEEIQFTVSYDEEAQVIYVKLVNTLERSVSVELETEMPLTGLGEAYVMQGQEEDVNSIGTPRNIAPHSYPLETAGSMVYELGPKSFHVLKMYCGA